MSVSLRLDVPTCFRVRCCCCLVGRCKGVFCIEDWLTLSGGGVAVCFGFAVSSGGVRGLVGLPQCVFTVIPVGARPLASERFLKEKEEDD